MTAYKNIFLTGGSGLLGTELQNQASMFGVNFIAPSSAKCNITKPVAVYESLMNFDGDVVLHSAACTDVKKIESDSLRACEVNVGGTLNIIKACMRHGKKLVFISTDHVFDGKKGGYKTVDPLNPLTKYAKTKAAAELIVRTYDNSLVIRTSFFGTEFPHPAAFTDQWSSKDYVDLIAPKIIEAALSDKKGIIHIGTHRRSLYEIACVRKPSVEKMSRKEINFITPKDTSLEII